MAQEKPTVDGVSLVLRVKRSDSVLTLHRAVGVVPMGLVLSDADTLARRTSVAAIELSVDDRRALAAALLDGLS